MKRPLLAQGEVGQGRFRLELDIHLFFVPPMEEQGPGIVLTRTIELPFPPYSGLAIHGATISENPEPIGFRIGDVTWDLDRSVFLARTTLISQKFPFSYIAEEIAAWIGRGWRLGSYVDSYEQPEEDEVDDQIGEGDGTDIEEADEFEESENWPKLRPQDRPKDFNKLFRAVVRKMAELHNNPAVAYAMWKTQRYFSDAELKELDTPAAKRFWEAEADYRSMTIDDQMAWHKRVMKAYPRLEKLISKQLD